MFYQVKRGKVYVSLQNFCLCIKSILNVLIKDKVFNGLLLEFDGSEKRV